LIDWHPLLLTLITGRLWMDEVVAVPGNVHNDPGMPAGAVDLGRHIEHLAVSARIVSTNNTVSRHESIRVFGFT
jgi:hypothetical protein